MKQEKHNPTHKLVSTIQPTKNGYVELVYGVTNEGENEGLEVYHFKANELQQHQSFNYPGHTYPAKYRTMFVKLREYVRNGTCKPGHKLEIESI